MDGKVKEQLSNYATYMVESVREQLGLSYDDTSRDDEVLAKLTGGEKLSKSKHMV